jgi:hypothetical protein
MTNPDPHPATRFQKGHKKVGGRQPGRRNNLTTDLKEALIEAATRVGFVREVPVLDADGNPTGRMKPEWDGDGRLAGYLVALSDQAFIRSC